jgi:hypothetical protein
MRTPLRKNTFHLKIVWSKFTVVARQQRVAIKEEMIHTVEVVDYLNREAML